MQAGTDTEAEILSVLQSVAGRQVDLRLKGDLAADLGFDSIKTLELVAALEDHFDVSIPLNDLPSIKSVAQVVEHTIALLGEQRKVDGRAPDPSRGTRVSGEHQ